MCCALSQSCISQWKRQKQLAQAILSMCCHSEVFLCCSSSTRCVDTASPCTLVAWQQGCLLFEQAAYLVYMSYSLSTILSTNIPFHGAVLKHWLAFQTVLGLFCFRWLTRQKTPVFDGLCLHATGERPHPSIQEVCVRLWPDERSRCERAREERHR